MLVYSSQLSSRLKYIVRVLFQDVLKVAVELTDDYTYFEQYEGAKINYSMRQLGDELFIESHGLLTEKGISDQAIQPTQWNGFPIFFQTNSQAIIPFDVFSASFYLLSRYEEYLPHIRDHYERFMAKESLAYQYGFLQKPLVNLWLQQLVKIIQEKYPDFQPPKQSFHYCSTIDIDNAYCYLEKGLLRTLGAFVRSALNADWESCKERWRVLRKQDPDPYDTFEKQLDLQEKYKLPVIYFVLLADYGLNDKNIPVESRKFQLLIKHLADHSEVGIHPSFGSNSQQEKLGMEWKRLKDILKREVTQSRQHFLKLSFPTTYRNLLDLDIHNDYSMGYAAIPGFRASICTPYHFYDLELEQSTALLIHPFVVMDATFKYYLNYSPAQSLELIKKMVDEVKAVDGTFVSLWHNETWSEHGAWKGWGKLYEQMVQYIKS